jgi:hypothetical protein
MIKTIEEQAQAITETRMQLWRDVAVAVASTDGIRAAVDEETPGRWANATLRAFDKTFRVGAESLC